MLIQLTNFVLFVCFVSFVATLKKISPLLLCECNLIVKESCLILLQTIPASIDIELFKADLLKTFDDIVSVHDLHIWQLTSSKYVSTVHILFNNPNVSNE